MHLVDLQSNFLSSNVEKSTFYWIMSSENRTGDVCEDEKLVFS